MAIESVRVENFKSFQELNIKLRKLNVIIGSNASGKSNFIKIFQFLRDIENYGLDNAISIQGGVQYLRNLIIGPERNLIIEIGKEQQFGFGIRLERGFTLGLRNTKAIYRFALRFNKKGSGFEVVDDKLSYNIDFYRLTRKGSKYEERDYLGQGSINLINEKGKYSYKIDGPSDIKVDEERLVPPLLPLVKPAKNTLIIENKPGLFMPLPFTVSDITIYDIDPKLPKRAVPFQGKANLEGNGENLAIVLKLLLRNRDNRRKLINLLSDILPFVEKVKIEKLDDNSMICKVLEQYAENEYLSAPYISDGTINILAMIVALYFEKGPLTIIEEPERNIHPYLISKIVEMLKDASKNIQIIVSTHNPELIKNIDIGDLLLIHRSNRGISEVKRPKEIVEVKKFLENDIGIFELFVDNLLK